MVLRDAAGHVVDSLNYGDLVDPWASGGFRGAAGKAATCHAQTPGIPGVQRWDRALPGIPFSGAVVQVDPTNGSTGRYPDGEDSDNDCADFVASASVRIDPLTNVHLAGTSVTATGDLATPGAPNLNVRRTPGQ
jgi:hypothetical protein